MTPLDLIVWAGATAIAVVLLSLAAVVLVAAAHEVRKTIRRGRL